MLRIRPIGDDGRVKHDLPVQRGDMLTISDHITQYVHERHSLGHVTADTAEGIRQVLGHMARHVPEDPTQVTVTHLRAWLVRNERGTGRVAPRTVALRTVRARHFFAWLEECQIIDRSPARSLDAPKVPKGQPRFLERDEVLDVTSVAHTPRDLAMVVLMVQMGLRRIEIHRARIDDVGDDRLAVRGKGGDGEVTRWVPIPTEAREALNAWLRFRPQHTELLFCTSTGKPLALNWISRKVSEMMREAGVKDRPGDGRSAHALRHSTAQHLVDDGVPLRVVQAVLGHASVTTTEQYVRRDVEVLASVLEGRSYVA
jgi:integrase/recombinase XerC